MVVFILVLLLLIALTFANPNAACWANMFYFFVVIGCIMSYLAAAVFITGLLYAIGWVR